MSQGFIHGILASGFCARFQFSFVKINETAKKLNIRYDQRLTRD